jgi:hypothetical protein
MSRAHAALRNARQRVDGLAPLAKRPPHLDAQFPSPPRRVVELASGHDEIARLRLPLLEPHSDEYSSRSTEPDVEQFARGCRTSLPPHPKRDVQRC